MMTWNRRVIDGRPESKVICSFQNVLKIIFTKKLFMECMEEKESLGRHKAAGASSANDSKRADC